MAIFPTNNCYLLQYQLIKKVFQCSETTKFNGLNSVSQKNTQFLTQEKIRAEKIAAGVTEQEGKPPLRWGEWVFAADP